MSLLAPALRALGLALVLLTAAACVPWPPPPGSCIEATRGGRHSSPRYTLAGRSASREQVEEAVAASSPEGRARVARTHALFTAGFAVLGSGVGAYVGGLAAVLASNQSGYLGLIAAGGVAMVVGAGLLWGREEPFEAAVLEFNRVAARDGTCGKPGP